MSDGWSNAYNAMVSAQDLAHRRLYLLMFSVVGNVVLAFLLAAALTNGGHL